MSFESDPPTITDAIMSAITADFPNATAVMIVSQYPNGDASLAVAGKNMNEADIVETLQKGITAWRPTGSVTWEDLT